MGDCSAATRRARRAGAGAEKANLQCGDLRIRARPCYGLPQSGCKQGHVEHVAPVASLLLSEEINKRCGLAAALEQLSHIGVAWAKPAASAPMGEDDEAGRPLRNGQES